MGWKDTLVAVDTAIKASNLDEAERLLRQAELEKKAEGLGQSETKSVDASARLPFGDASTDAAPENTDSIAVKSWFTQKYGAVDTGVQQVATELYGRDYRHVAWAKAADFVRYIRTGQADPKLHRTLLYSPEQILEAVASGRTVAELKATQIESQDTLGGYLVPEDVRDRIVKRLVGMTIMREVAEKITTTRDRVTFPVALGGDDRYTTSVRATWVDESPTSSQAETNATFGQVTIPVHTLMAHTPVSKNLLEDSAGANAIVPFLERAFAEAIAIVEDEAFLIGDGVAKPQGILNGNGTGGPFTYAYGAVQTVNSGGATSLTGDAFRNTPYAIASQYRQQGGIWAMSRGSVRVVKTLKDGSGAYLWADRQQQLQNGQPTKLEGYDIKESEALASPTTNSGTTYTANVYPILFICRGAYLIVDRVGMDVQRYDDATTARTNSIVVVARYRVGGQVIDPWRIATMKVSA